MLKSNIMITSYKKGITFIHSLLTVKKLTRLGEATDVKSQGAQFR
jgi:hypothetical protein